MIADGAHLTLSNEKALEAAQTILTDSVIVPIHTDSWDHFTQTSDQIEELFAAAGISNSFIALRPGQSVSLPAALPSTAR